VPLHRRSSGNSPVGSNASSARRQFRRVPGVKTDRQIHCSPCEKPRRINLRNRQLGHYLMQVSDGDFLTTPSCYARNAGI
jgi:hypothetical protein